MNKYRLSSWLILALLCVAASASARTLFLELGTPPVLPNAVSDVGPETGEEPSALPGGFIPGVSHLRGPVNRVTDLSLGAGGTGGAVDSKGTSTVIMSGLDAPNTHFDVAASDGLNVIGNSNSNGPVLNGPALAAPENGSALLLLAISAGAILSARRFFSTQRASF